MYWRIRAIRGATTCENTVASIREAVTELLDVIEAHNQLDHSEIFTVTFSATADLDAIFPAAIARERQHWDQIPLLDVQQMSVNGGLKKCIRCLIQFNTQTPDQPIHHVYLREAKHLRPDLSLPHESISHESISHESISHESISHGNIPETTFLETHLSEDAILEESLSAQVLV